MSVESVCCADLPPGVIVAPTNVQARSDGSFQYDWAYRVGDNPITLAGLGAENIDNTQGVTHGDSFCQSTSQPGQTIRWTVSGRLVDVSRTGRVQNFLALCQPGSATTETLVLPFAPTPAEAATWGRVKVLYR